MLLIIININKEVNRIVLPGLFDPRRALNSVCKVMVILDHRVWIREGLAQKILGMINKINRVESQLSGASGIKSVILINLDIIHFIVVSRVEAVIHRAFKVSAHSVINGSESTDSLEIHSDIKFVGLIILRFGVIFFISIKFLGFGMILEDGSKLENKFVIIFT